VFLTRHYQGIQILISKMGSGYYFTNPNAYIYALVIGVSTIPLWTQPNVACTLTIVCFVGKRPAQDKHRVRTRRAHFNPLRLVWLGRLCHQETRTYTFMCRWPKILTHQSLLAHDVTVR
jgi:hypothetical protein